MEDDVYVTLNISLTLQNIAKTAFQKYIFLAPE